MKNSLSSIMTYSEMLDWMRIQAKSAKGETFPLTTSGFFVGVSADGRLFMKTSATERGIECGEEKFLRALKRADEEGRISPMLCDRLREVAGCFLDHMLEAM